MQVPNGGSLGSLLCWSLCATEFSTPLLTSVSAGDFWSLCATEFSTPLLTSMSAGDFIPRVGVLMISGSKDANKDFEGSLSDSIHTFIRILSTGVDSVGTISASLVTYASILALQPDLIINAGTAGGFKCFDMYSTLMFSCFQAKGASIADIFLASDVAFHDRRIPIPVFDLYGVGLRQAFPTPNLVKTLNLKVGKLSTGDSLDTSPKDEASIVSNDATIKDMEGAAVAYVADLLKVPAIFVKAVIDIVDGDKPTGVEFLQNLLAVTAALDQAVTEVVDFINGRCLSEL
ncbi:hypothetical protein C3L33_19880, partial [Rhododendron williamsianum]